MAAPPIRATVSANFTRPADTTAYASGDLMANSTTAGSVVPMTFKDVVRSPGAHAQLRRVRVYTSSTSVTNAAFRVHLYDAASITCANGDNAAWSTNRASGYLGSVDVTVDKAMTDGACGAATAEINFSPALTTTNILGLMEARGAYTPTSAGVFNVVLELAQD